MTEINLEARYVNMSGSAIAYDYLVIAVGAETNFFGMETVEQSGFQAKDIRTAVSTRNHFLKLFEQASHEADAEKRRVLLTFIVVGGGPTGVETAGALASECCSERFIPCGQWIDCRAIQYSSNKRRTLLSNNLEKPPSFQPARFQ